MPKATPGKQPLHLLFDDAIVKRIDDFRYDCRFPTRAEAVRWLVQAALDKKLVPKTVGKKGE